MVERDVVSYDFEKKVRRFWPLLENYKSLTSNRHHSVLKDRDEVNLFNTILWLY
jgi:hypothetical protein